MEKNYPIILSSETILSDTLAIADKHNNAVFLVSEGENFSGYLTDRWIRVLATDTTNLNKPVKNFVLNNFYVRHLNGKGADKSFSLENYNLVIEKGRDKVENVYGPVMEEIIPDLKSVPVVIMAGGSGVRLKPYTEIVPKPLLPIDNKAVVEIIIDRFRDYKVSDFFITLNYQASFIKAFFAQKSRDYNIYFVEEEMPLGTIGAIKFLEKNFDRPFFVSNCDVLIKTSYTKLYDFHLKHNFDITLVGVVKKTYIPYGVCKVNDEMELVELQEKPNNIIIVNAGLYVLNPSVIRYIPYNERFDITDLITRVKQQGGRVGVFPISSESWVDIGTLEEFKKNISKLI